jgi:hypothetical protein
MRAALGAGATGTLVLAVRELDKPGHERVSPAGG